MVCGEILWRLDDEIPLSYAESWDNSGLQVGRRNTDVEKVYIALDATNQVLAHCIEVGADLLVTHHPLLMDGIKKISADDLHGEKILTLAEQGIVHYAAHTNFDATYMGVLCSDYLHLEDARVLEETPDEEMGSQPDLSGEDRQRPPRLGIGMLGDLPRWMTVRECCTIVKQAFGLKTVKVFGDLSQKVHRAAICPGSGKSLIGVAIDKAADIYITGDIGHHDGIDAVDQGIVILDAGHYGLEHVFIPWMDQFFRRNFPQLTVFTEPIEEPFTVV